MIYMNFLVVLYSKVRCAWGTGVFDKSGKEDVRASGDMKIRRAREATVDHKSGRRRSAQWYRTVYRLAAGRCGQT